MNFLFAIFLVTFMAKAASEAFERIGLPAVLGEYGAGILLGASFLNAVKPAEIEMFAVIGVILLMFIAGYDQCDVTGIIRSDRRKLWTAVAGLVITVAVLLAAMPGVLGLSFNQALFLSFILAATDMALFVRMLLSRNMMHAPIVKDTLELGIIDTIVELVLLACTIVLVAATSLADLGPIIGGAFIFFAIILFAGKYLPRLINQLVEMRTEEIEFSIVLLSVFLLAFIAEELGIASILGAYFAGVALRKTEALRTEHFNDTMRSISYGFFIPLFFAWMGLRTTASSAVALSVPVLTIVGIALASKFIIVSLSGGLLRKGGFRTAITKGFAMMPRGTDNIVILSVGLALGVAAGQEALFSGVVFSSILLSSLISFAALKILLKPAVEAGEIS